MIYVVRHGQTDWNLISKLQGRVNTSLNETGIKQAQEQKAKLEGIKFDKVFCSPLNRAKETCEIIYGRDDVVFDKRLIERDFGEYEGKKKSEFDYEGFWNSTKNQKFERAENIFEITNRVYDFLDEIKSKYADKNVLIVCHGGVGLIITSYFKGKPADGNYLQFLVGTGEKMIFDFNNKVSTK